MPPSKLSPLGPEWVRVLACFLGMCFLPGTLAAIWFAPNQWIVITALPSSVGVFLHSAHTLHTGSPPPMRPLLRYLLDCFARWQQRK
jgi:hypothetical protein